MSTLNKSIGTGRNIIECLYTFIHNPRITHNFKAVFNWVYLKNHWFPYLASHILECLLTVIGLQFVILIIYNILVFVLRYVSIEIYKGNSRLNFQDSSLFSDETKASSLFPENPIAFFLRTLISSIVDIGISLGLVLPVVISCALYTHHPWLKALTKPAADLKLEDLRVDQNILIGFAFTIFVLLTVRHLFFEIFGSFLKSANHYKDKKMAFHQHVQTVLGIKMLNFLLTIRKTKKSDELVDTEGTDEFPDINDPGPPPAPRGIQYPSPPGSNRKENPKSSKNEP